MTVTVEFSAIECLKYVIGCGYSSVFSLIVSLLFLQVRKTVHIRMLFEFENFPTTDFGVSCPLSI